MSVTRGFWRASTIARTKAKTVEWRNEAITSFCLRVDPDKKGWREEWRERKNPQWKRNLMASRREKKDHSKAYSTATEHASFD